MGNYDLHYFNTVTNQWESPFTHSADFEAHVNGMTHINYLGDVYDESKSMTEYKEGITVERKTISTNTPFLTHTNGYVLVETYRNIASWRGYQRATYYSSASDTNIVYIRIARGTQAAPVWGAWIKQIDSTDIPKITAFVSSEITPDTDMSTLSDGVYYTHPLPNESSALYLAWRDHIAGFMDITSPSLYMRLMITTVRYYGRNYQIINVLSGTTTYLNKPLFTCTRASVTDNNWCDWSFSYPTLYGEGNPQGSVLGVNNMKYIDTLTGDLYVKLSSTKLTPTNAGWAKIGGVTNA